MALSFPQEFHRNMPANVAATLSTENHEQQKATDPGIWEATMSVELSEASAACLQGLSRIPTGLGKLAYLAILQKKLLDDHNELFREWFGCSLQQKYDWVYRFLVSVSSRGALPNGWLSASVYSDLVPLTADGRLRDLYRSEIDAVLDILMKEIDRNQGEPVQVRDLGAEAPNWMTVR